MIDFSISIVKSNGVMPCLHVSRVYSDCTYQVGLIRLINNEHIYTDDCLGSLKLAKGISLDEVSIKIKEFIIDRIIKKPDLDIMFEEEETEE